jgi:hypothetical protein
VRETLLAQPPTACRWWGGHLMISFRLVVRRRGRARAYGPSRSCQRRAARRVSRDEALPRRGAGSQPPSPRHAARPGSAGGGATGGTIRDQPLDISPASSLHATRRRRWTTSTREAVGLDPLITGVTLSRPCRICVTVSSALLISIHRRTRELGALLCKLSLGESKTCASEAKIYSRLRDNKNGNDAAPFRGVHRSATHPFFLRYPWSAHFYSAWLIKLF